MEILKLDHLSFSYKKCEVLKDINYTFNKGEVYSIIGHNGAGKTTFIRICLNILPVQQGKVEYIGHPVVSYVPDRGGLYEWLTVEQNIRTFLELNHVESEYSEKFVEENLKKWGLNEKRDVVVRHLSMGQKQRLSLIVAEVNDPDLIFLDEPTNSIDISSQEMLNQHLIDLKKRGKTILISSHDIHLIEQVSDKILILDNHELVFECQSHEIKNLTALYKKYTEEVEA